MEVRSVGSIKAAASEGGTRSPVQSLGLTESWVVLNLNGQQLLWGEKSQTYWSLKRVVRSM